MSFMISTRWKPERKNKSKYKTKADSEVGQHYELQKVKRKTKKMHCFNN